MSLEKTSDWGRRTTAFYCDLAAPKNQNAHPDFERMSIGVIFILVNVSCYFVYIIAE
jgi:hypothetical protein